MKWYEPCLDSDWKQIFEANEELQYELVFDDIKELLLILLGVIMTWSL